jgi:large subunit ribosomal protein L23
MKLQPLFTEKSMSDAKLGKYSFWVNREMTKTDIKNAVNKAFGVHVKSVQTVNFKESKRRTLNGKFQTKKARKKAIVGLTGKETISLFEEKKEDKK